MARLGESDVLKASMGNLVPEPDTWPRLPSQLEHPEDWRSGRACLKGDANE